MKDDATEQIGHMRVVKKLPPTSRGAIRLGEQFGKTLICVRHRVDAKARIRHFKLKTAPHTTDDFRIVVATSMLKVLR